MHEIEFRLVVAVQFSFFFLFFAKKILLLMTQFAQNSSIHQSLPMQDVSVYFCSHHGTGFTK
jgi:hypothetical protein